MNKKQLSEYKNFLQEIFKLTEYQMKLENFTWSGDDSYQARELLEKNLTNDEVEAVNKLLQRVFQSGIVSVLELLNEKQNTGQLEIISNEIKLLVEPFGNELSIDLLTLIDGEKWPDETNCPVHNILLQVEKAPIKYGLIKYPSNYYQSKDSTFPFANLMVVGGCIGRSVEFQNVVYCSKCREALLAWNKENGTNYGLP